MKKQLVLERESCGHKESNSFADEVAKKITQVDTILFYGDLGSGKTYLIKNIVSYLGIKTEASSPSFSIINQYEGNFVIYHIDLYRIKNKQEMINTGLEEILSTEAVLLIEWPQIIEDEITWEHYRIYIETSQKNEYWRKLLFYKVS